MKTKRKIIKTTINTQVAWGIRTKSGGDFVSTVQLDEKSAGLDAILGMFDPAYDRSNGEEYESVTFVDGEWGEPIRYYTQSEAEVGHLSLVKKTFKASTSIP